MNKVAVSCAIGVVAGLVLAGAYIAAPYAGLQIAAAQAMVFAAILAFCSSTAAFVLVALNKPVKEKVPRSTRFNDLPATEFVRPLQEPGGLHITMRPDSTVEILDVYRHPETYADKSILVTLKKSSGKSVFNPVVLRQLFTALKTFAKFDHILLMNEHDEFVGYIPALRARTDFIGNNGESAITKYIINVLAEPATSSILRDIGGLSTDEMISDNDTIARAVELTWDGLKRGLVICKGRRNRKPVSIIFKEDLYKLAAYGA
jgi:hypothetical protein